MNIYDRHRTLVEDAPDSLHIIDDHTRLTRHQFARLVETVATNLVGLGIGRGSRVALALPNDVSHVATMLALAKIGGAYVSLSRGDRLQSLNLLERVKVKAIISRLPFSVPSGEANILIRDLTTQSHNNVAAAPDCSDAGNVVWKFITSSGSTGAPKLVAATHLIEDGWHHRAALNPPSGDENMFLQTTDLSFPWGARNVLHFLQLGVPVRLTNNHVNPRDMYAHLSQHRIGYIMTTPSRCHDFLRFLTGEELEISRLAAVNVGTALVLPELRDLANQHLCDELYVSYGTNEVGVISLADPELNAKFPDTIGVASPGTVYEVVDEQDRVLGQGEQGRLRCQGPQFLTSYFDDPEADKEAFRNGWFYLGDICSIGAEGELYIHGRADDTINFCGIKIFPADVERLIRKHPAIIDAVVLPVPHRAYQEIPVAVVEVNQPIEPNQLRDQLNERLGSRGVHNVFIAGRLPRNDLGKIRKADLLREIEKLRPEKNS